jgi:hypothetical protein
MRIMIIKLKIACTSLIDSSTIISIWFSGELMKGTKELDFAWNDEDVQRVNEIIREIGLAPIHLKMTKEEFRKVLSR